MQETWCCDEAQLEHCTYLMTCELEGTLKSAGTGTAAARRETPKHELYITSYPFTWQLPG